MCLDQLIPTCPHILSLFRPLYYLTGTAIAGTEHKCNVLLETFVVLKSGPALIKPGKYTFATKYSYQVFISSCVSDLKCVLASANKGSFTGAVALNKGILVQK